MVPGCTEISISFGHNKTAVLAIDLGQNILCILALPHACSNYMQTGYKIDSVGQANKNLLQNSSAFILCKGLKSAVYKTILLIFDYFNMKELIGTQFISCLASNLLNL